VISSIGSKMDKYRALQNAASTEQWSISAFSFQSLATLHKKTENIKDDISRSSAGNYTSIVFLVAIGILLLALACFNYINIAIASAAKRLKEIGIRKTIGATRKVVIIQFLSENIILTFFALFVGMAMATSIFIPGFEQMWNFNMGFNLLDPMLWIYLPCVVLITAIASGLYPAMYISRFQVIKIMKGSVRFGTKSPLTKIFLTLQLIFACIFISSAIMFMQNNDYLADRSWGYDQKSVLYVSIPDYAAFEKLRAPLERNPHILAVAGSEHHLGKGHEKVTIQMPDRKFEVDQLAVDPQYVASMKLQIRSGRSFVENSEKDRNGVIVNNEFVRSVYPGSTHAEVVGKVFTLDSVQQEIVGVVADFHSYSFNHKLRPTIITLAAKDDYHYLSMRVAPGKELEAYQDLQKQWATLFPEIPFQGGYQEDVWPGYFEGVEIFELVWQVFAIIAVSLAGLGLYGLISLNVAGRTKEFSIRKVLGATIRNLTSLVSSQYLILLAIALMVAAPLSYYFGSWLITVAYVYYKPVDLSSIIFAMLILCGLLTAAISSKMLGVVKTDPVKGLKTE
jgi:putative ABC transport system permease protein